MIRENKPPNCAAPFCRWTITFFSETPLHYFARDA
jgi:hypothetical protein